MQSLVGVPCDRIIIKEFIGSYFAEMKKCLTIKMGAVF